MSEAMDKALEKDRDEWSVDYDAEPGIAGNAFERGWKAAQAVSPLDRETLVEGLKVAMLGTTDGGFIDSDSEIPAGEMFRLAGEWVEDVLAALSTQPGIPGGSAVSLPDREALVNEEAVFEYFGLNNLYVLPVLAADGDPYLIGTSEDGEMFAQGLPLEDDTGATNMNNGHLEDKPEEWWPLVPLMPVAALSPAPLNIDHDSLFWVIDKAFRDSWSEAMGHERSPMAITDAVIAHLSAQTASTPEIPDNSNSPEIPDSSALSTQPAAGESLSAQVDRLAAFIVDEVHGEPSRPEGAIDTAIRIIREQQAVEAENHRAYLWVQGINPDAENPEPAPELAELFPGTLAALDRLSIRPEVQS